MRAGLRWSSTNYGHEGVGCLDGKVDDISVMYATMRCDPLATDLTLPVP